MPVDVDRAMVFIRAQGNEFDRARLDVLLGDGPPLSPEQERRFLAGQRADGGWPAFWGADYRSLGGPCYRWAQAESIGMAFSSPALVHAAAFLRSRQGKDGSWEEAEAVRELAPSWARPGELAPRLYLTANCGWWLATAAL